MKPRKWETAWGTIAGPAWTPGQPYRGGVIHGISVQSELMDIISNHWFDTFAKAFRANLRHKIKGNTITISVKGRRLPKLGSRFPLPRRRFIRTVVDTATVRIP